MRSATLCLLLLSVLAVSSMAQSVVTGCNCKDSCANEPDSCEECFCSTGCAPGYAFPDKGCLFDCSVCATFQECDENVGCLSKFCASDDDCTDSICGPSSQCIYDCSEDGFVIGEEEFVQCNEGETCSDSAGCNGCTSVQDCSIPLTCDPDTYTCACIPEDGCECLTDDDCENADEECQFNTCFPAGVLDCTVDEDCDGDGEVCFSGSCFNSCIDDIGCSEGEECLAGVCIPTAVGCSVDEECDVFETCVEGECTPGGTACETDLDCDINAVCDDAICIPDVTVECDVDAECEPFESCLANTCIVTATECTTDDECFNPQTCQGGFCLGGCTSDDDCTGDDFCLVTAGFCIPLTCETVEDCTRDGQECINGLCLTPECTTDDDCPGVLSSCFLGLCIGDDDECVEDADCVDGPAGECDFGFCVYNACANTTCSLFEFVDENDCTCECDLLCSANHTLSEDGCSCGCPAQCPMGCDDNGECSAECAACPEGTVCVDMEAIKDELFGDTGLEFPALSGDICVCNATAGVWGPGCDLPCDESCVVGVCEASTGECVVSIGAVCEEDCSQFAFCNPLHGVCECFPGYYYGNGTTGNFTECLPCADDCEFNICNQTSSECIDCPLDCGEDARCELDVELFLEDSTVEWLCACNADTWGPNCTEPCPEECDFFCNDFTGLCEDCLTDDDCDEGLVCGENLGCVEGVSCEGLVCEAPFELNEDLCACECAPFECPNNNTLDRESCTCNCPEACPVGCYEDTGLCPAGCGTCNTDTSICVPATSAVPDPDVPGDWACICPNDKWGVDCNRDCSDLCVGGACAAANGVCLYGHTCQDTEHCNEPNRICDPAGTGECVCQANTYENEAGDCVSCPDCPGGLCDSDGVCTAVACDAEVTDCQGFCAPGDDTCYCGVGTYGPPSCNSTCHPACAEDCDPVTGECPEGTVNCAGVDDCNGGRGMCVGVDECICVDFYWGPGCENECSCPVPDSDGVVSCFDDGSCPYTCEQGCHNGDCSFTGSVCSCHEGWFGDDCSLVCDHGEYNSAGAINDDSAVECQACPAECPMHCSSPNGLCPPAVCDEDVCGDHELCVFPESDTPCHCPLGQYSMMDMGHDDDNSTSHHSNSTSHSMCVDCEDCPAGCVVMHDTPVCYPEAGEMCSDDETFACAHPFTCIQDELVNATSNATTFEPSGVCDCPTGRVGPDCACEAPSEEILGLCGDLWPSGYITGTSNLPTDLLMHYLRLIDFTEGGAGDVDDHDNHTMHHTTRDDHSDEHSDLSTFCVDHFREIVCLAAFSECQPSVTPGVPSVIRPACAENEMALHHLCHAPWHLHVLSIWPGFGALETLNPVHADGEDCLFVECPLGTNPVNCMSLGDPDCGNGCDLSAGDCVWGEGNVPTCECHDNYYGPDCSQKCSCYYAGDLEYASACNDGADGDGSCICHEGYFGSDCSQSCDCPDTARCNSDTGRCDSCLDGFYGRQCDQECDCGQGACNDGILGDGSCTCPDGTVGERCDVCPCQNGGTCRDEGVDDDCDCPADFTGELCEVACPIGVNGEVCNGQGLCFEGGCACFPGFGGDACDDCEIGCQFGFGSCSNSTGACECSEGWTGPWCSNPVCDICPEDEICLSPTLCGCEFGSVKNPETGLCEPIEVTGTWGDPHFQTLDGLDYTFNGVGEFWAVKFTGEDGGECGVQIRTEECAGQTGVTCITSVGWTAGQTFVTVQPNSNGTALSTRVDGDGEVTLFTEVAGIPYNLVGGDSIVDASPSSAPGSNIVGTMCGGVGGRVVTRLNSGVMGLFLQLPASVAGNTSGLYGDWDGDVSNDLAPLAANASEAEIYSQFGESWRVAAEADSLFVRLAGEAPFAEVNTAGNFTPVFTDEISLDPADLAEYEEICASRGLTNGTAFYEACLFDLSATGGDVSFAAASEGANALNECLGGGGSGCEAIVACPNACTSPEVGTCDYTTGTCACTDGTAYGEDCSGVCADCPAESTCDVALGCVCNDNTFGEDCTPCTCSANSTCADDGSCVCDDGFYGVDCEFACSDACEGTCDSATGLCLKCPIGFFGEDCTGECPGFDAESGTVCSGNGFCSDDVDGNGECTSCQSGFFGADCSESCSANCANNPPASLGAGSCSQEDGSCVCLEGFFGATCDESCSANCAGNGTCDDSGVCDEGCADGFYGDSCAEACSANCGGNGTCDSTGVCTDGCAEGYHGDSCDEACSASCLDGQCDAATGECTTGCADADAYGPQCEACPMGDDPTTVESDAVVCSGGVCNSGLSGDGSCSDCPEGTEGPTCAPVSGADEDADMEDEGDADVEPEDEGEPSDPDGPSGLTNILLAVAAGAAFLLFCGAVSRANKKEQSDSGKPALNDAGDEPMSPPPQDDVPEKV